MKSKHRQKQKAKVKKNIDDSWETYQANNKLSKK